MESSIPVIKNWLQSCIHHSSCISPTLPLLPARILYIGGLESSRIHLKENGTEKARYICLSYCWGKAEFFKLMSSNVEACRQGIDLASLPASFQYAIAVARYLAIDYIWIDASCIIQDDLRDWEIQASTMADVYQRSFLVLAMTQNSRPEQTSEAQELPTVTTIDGIQICRLLHASTTLPVRPDVFPLMCRAWAFQERILAPRVLHFGPYELFWECFSCRDCECGRDREDQASSGHNVSKKTFFDELIQKRGDFDIEGLWHRLVEEYSKLTLTFQHDTLPALPGIATVMQTVRNGVYLARALERFSRRRYAMV
jgi:Heterokaryon incompatibility protein (HET)